MASKSFNNIMEQVIIQANSDLYDDKKYKFLETFVDMNEVSRNEVFDIIWEILDDIIFKRASTGKDIIIPHIGTLKIKPLGIIGRQIKKEVAEELGYIEWYTIPKDKIEYARQLMKTRFDKKVKEFKNSGGIRNIDNMNKIRVTKAVLLKLPKEK